MATQRNPRITAAEARASVDAMREATPELVADLRAQLAAAEARVAERDAVLRAVGEWLKAHDRFCKEDGMDTLGKYVAAGDRVKAAFNAARSGEVQDGK